MLVSLAMTLSVVLRHASSEDTQSIAQLFTETVHTVNAGDYGAEQLDAWAPRPPDLESWRRRLSGGSIVLVAEAENRIAGFATYTTDGHLELRYTHPRFLRRGIATGLLKRIEDHAQSLRISRLFAEVSVTACPFFSLAGFRLVAEQTVERRGVAFLNYRMEKLL